MFFFDPCVYWIVISQQVRVTSRHASTLRLLSSDMKLMVVINIYLAADW